MNLNLLGHVRLPVTVAAMSLCINLCMAQSGSTTITEWQYGKNGAVSITYDEASRNQFTRALPVMERLKIPATFFVITGPITGSKYQGKFVGRPVKKIIAESATIPTNNKNFLERCSAAGYFGYKGTISYLTRAGGLYSSGKKQQAFNLMDKFTQKCGREISNPVTNHAPNIRRLDQPGTISESMQPKDTKLPAIPLPMPACLVLIK